MLDSSNNGILLPFKVVEQEEEGHQVGLWQRQQQVEHAALLGHAVRESCRAKAHNMNVLVSQLGGT